MIEKEIIELSEKANMVPIDRCPSNRNIECPRSALINVQKNKIDFLHKHINTLQEFNTANKKEKRKSFLFGWTIATLVSAAMQVVWFTKDIWLGWF